MINICGCSLSFPATCEGICKVRSLDGLKRGKKTVNIIKFCGLNSDYSCDYRTFYSAKQITNEDLHEIIKNQIAKHDEKYLYKLS